jgi:hypothetical protein
MKNFLLPTQRYNALTINKLEVTMATLASISYAIAFAKTFVDLASRMLASIAHRVGRTEAEPLAGTAQTSFVALTACTVNNAIRRGRSSGS